ncbi:hypothetical protein Ahy_A07g036024 isoform A [Arachis hypogaea]|uniref:Carbohydrate kinase PfkB domain-containing protein n=1 Tax=Arachis hypogaea TaxID=3818 RepID=A0A445CF17_ARAHY|nr:hypothetical protein Ahy_A07g036024 isoform A [Arachis hypogaea]
MLCDILKQNFVDTSGVHFDSEARTALAFVMLKADAELEFLFFRNPSADMLLHESEIDKNLYRSLIHDPSKSAHLAPLYYTKKFKGQVVGVKVNPIDTAGAGDAFVSGILYSICS